MTLTRFDRSNNRESLCLIDPIAPIPEFIPVIGYPEDVSLPPLVLRLACEPCGTMPDLAEAD